MWYIHIPLVATAKEGLAVQLFVSRITKNYWMQLPQNLDGGRVLAWIDPINFWMECGSELKSGSIRYNYVLFDIGWGLIGLKITVWSWQRYAFYRVHFLFALPLPRKSCFHPRLFVGWLVGLTAWFPQKLVNGWNIFISFLRVHGSQWKHTSDMCCCDLSCNCNQTHSWYIFEMCNLLL